MSETHNHLYTLVNSLRIPYHRLSLTLTYTLNSGDGLVYYDISKFPHVDHSDFESKLVKVLRGGSHAPGQGSQPKYHYDTFDFLKAI